MKGCFTFHFQRYLHGFTFAGVTAVYFSLVLSSAVAEVFTSSEKLGRLAEREVTLMARLQSYDHGELRLPLYFAKRVREFRQLPLQTFLDQFLHPNGAYLLIKSFVHTWPHVISADPALWSTADDATGSSTPLIPTQADVDGALSAMLRLQRIYGLSVVDMYAGDYAGFRGPSLSPPDTYSMGRQAFIQGLLREAVAWLELSSAGMGGTAGDVSRRGTADMMTSNESMTSNEDHFDRRLTTTQEKAAVLALLGRAHFLVGHEKKAKFLYERSLEMDPMNGDVLQLGQELEERLARNPVTESQVWHRNMKVLCSRNKHQRVEKIRRFHRCVYKRSLVSPWLRYKQEILSLTPYICLFHGVARDREVKSLKRRVSGNMHRGRVQNPQATGFIVSRDRISEMGWIHDSEDELVSAMSQRVKDFTWLEVEERLPHGPSSSEGFQLTDVDRGGHTVFLRAGVSVAPSKQGQSGCLWPPASKGMALFWYNYSPAIRMERLTLHAGCPVLKGHKWIANKWIWTYGNTFRRPCGPTPRASHQQVERSVMPSLLTFQFL
ncbi:prolyl 4-hydroxylase subunit alpha-2-like [Babylonia areolata]|uniref:prolyl 4-hydroxylase subunit alpha-2-like n=1 Tax=Babylonia areolata TaxID=304850 RepID=UPI003FD25263